jgi:hypothetical protein
MKKNPTSFDLIAALDKRVKAIENEPVPTTPKLALLWHQRDIEDYNSMRGMVKEVSDAPKITQLEEFDKTTLSPEEREALARILAAPSRPPVRWPRWVTVLALAGFIVFIGWRVSPKLDKNAPMRPTADSVFCPEGKLCPDNSGYNPQQNNMGYLYPNTDGHIAASSGTGTVGTVILKRYSKWLLAVSPQIEDCWIRISVGDSRVVAEGTVMGGNIDTYAFPVGQIATVRTGCPGGVRYWVNGEEIQPEESKQPHDTSKVELVEVKP